MKRLLLILVLLCSFNLSAQQTYVVNGESLQLYTEVEGELTLLWNTFDGIYRYFLKKDDQITELTNTKTADGFAQEYKTELATYVGPERAKNVKLIKPDLAAVVDYYNTSSDPNYESQITKVSLHTRLGGFAGVSNFVYNPNPDNTISYQIGAELEVMDRVKLKRHSFVFQLRHLIGGSGYDFNSSQLTLNYRFKFVNTEALAIYANVKVAGYIYNTQNIEIYESNGDLEYTLDSGGEFQAPGAFGVGADIALGKGFLTIQYQDFVAVNWDDNGEFPVDFAVGYKFNL